MMTKHLHSRIHPMHFKTESASVWIKREDELRGGMAGGKIRKLLSCLEYYYQHNYEEILAIGGSHSNNLVAVIQLFRERSIPFRILIPESHDKNNLSGNALLIELLTSEHERIIVPKSESNSVMKVVENILEKNDRKITTTSTSHPTRISS